MARKKETLLRVIRALEAHLAQHPRDTQSDRHLEKVKKELEGAR